MVSLVQISDPHFGTEQPPVVEALVRMVRAQSPDLLVLSGDITQRAHRSQFRAARAFVERLGVPATLAIPGNHDIKLLNVASRLFTPYANYCREFGDDLEPVFDAPQLLVVGVNTTRNYRHARGAVSGAQIERVADRLSRATEQQLRVVVTHQPVCVTLPRDEPDRLLGHARAVRRWAEAGAMEILCQDEREHSGALTAILLTQGHNADDLRRVIRQGQAQNHLSSPLIHFSSRYAVIVKKLGFGKYS